MVAYAASDFGLFFGGAKRRQAVANEVAGVLQFTHDAFQRFFKPPWPLPPATPAGRPKTGPSPDPQ